MSFLISYPASYLTVLQKRSYLRVPDRSTIVGIDKLHRPTFPAITSGYADFTTSRSEAEWLKLTRGPVTK